MATKNKINPIRRSITSLREVVSRLDKRGSSLSNISISLSGLNDAIIGMIQSDSKLQQCRQICVGNYLNVNQCYIKRYYTRIGATYVFEM